MLSTLQRARIILFAIMVFGAFANFAQNEWGTTLIFICQLLLAFSFFTQAVFIYRRRILAQTLRGFNIFQVSLLLFTWIVLPAFLVLLRPGETVAVAICLALVLLLTLVLAIDAILCRRKEKNGQPYDGGVFENYTLFMCFLAFFFMNMRWAGAGVLMVLSFVAMALPYYLAQTISFFSGNYKYGKALTLTLSAGIIATLLYGLAVVFRFMHYPGAMIFFYTGAAFTLLFSIGVTKRKFTYREETWSIIKGLSLFRSHIVMLSVAVFFYTWYRYLSSIGQAPAFYEAGTPVAITNLRATGKLSDAEKAREVEEAYYFLIEDCYRNGFIK